MPTVNVHHRDLISKIGDLTEKEIEKLCWRYGLELDEVTSEYEIIRREQGEQKATHASKDKIYKIEVPANRYDLLCVEGLTRALMIFENKLESPCYSLNENAPPISITVRPGLDRIRPFIVAGVVREVALTQPIIDSLMALQDKLHQNIGKRRQIVSIGTHDLDKVSPPFEYRAEPLADIKFAPLNHEAPMSIEEMRERYSRGDSHLRHYWRIIDQHDRYPLVRDARRSVLSLPPIINGNLSKIDLSTRNILVEVTGTNLHKISIALDTIVTAFSEYSSENHRFRIDPVEVRYESPASVESWPKLSTRVENVSIDYVNGRIGTSLGGEEMSRLLKRMALGNELVGNVLRVTVGPTRHDVLHKCDISEDVAIAFGYDNIPQVEYAGCSAGSSAGDTSLNRLSDEIRRTVACLGFLEVVSFVLCSRDDLSVKLNYTYPNAAPLLDRAVLIANPKTPECGAARTTLIPGLLHSLASNQHLPLPLSVFEVNDVVLLDKTKDVGSSNCRRVCAVHYGAVPDFDKVYNALTTLLHDLGYHYDDDDSLPNTYHMVEEPKTPMLMSGRSYRVIKSSERGPIDVGLVGILRTSVLRNFDIKKGLASVFEIDVEPFLHNDREN